MATGSIPCGIAVPQVFLDTPVDMPFVRDFVQRAEALDYESLWVQESIVSDFAILEPVAPAQLYRRHYLKGAARNLGPVDGAAQTRCSWPRVCRAWIR